MRHLEIYRIIRTVAAVGSIRRAADPLNITASALNRSIRQFEEDFGAPVFERHARGVRLTPAGRLLLDHILDQFSELDRIRAQAGAETGTAKGHVSIAASPALQAYLLPLEIAAWRRGNPEVTFSIYMPGRTPAEQELADFRSELALVLEPVHLGGLEVIAEVPMAIHAVMAAGHRLAAAETVTLEQCFAETCVIPTEPFGMRSVLEMGMRRSGRQVSPAVEADSFELMRQYVLFDEAVCFQIPVGLTPEVDPRLAMRRLAEPWLPEARLMLAKRRGRMLSHAAEGFAAHLAERIRALADG
ncbi:LysR substrate-binding domain-containing protein [Paralimibaculum aggregatum]|uniref:LysR substrate-binding domain-containing protein n=1 Tax=Paralimibaculum aggregatum TaxID=3036245 RepID=A0ABQ6LP85_9RHOB|nr:LysR family transcriptional regulator [Limibaculum sp. NKW23]GMG84296.1 LysR substrate-binding domain-containing protein [Limibaculum sp. NKW23]